MKVSELIAILKKQNQDASVFIAYEHNGGIYEEKVSDWENESADKVIIYGIDSDDDDTE